MTRKHYVGLARALKDARERIERNNGSDAAGPLEGWAETVAHVAAYLAHDNGSFDEARFIAAAGIRS